MTNTEIYLILALVLNVCISLRIYLDRRRIETCAWAQGFDAGSLSDAKYQVRYDPHPEDSLQALLDAKENLKAQRLMEWKLGQQERSGQ